MATETGTTQLREQLLPSSNPSRDCSAGIRSARAFICNICCGVSSRLTPSSLGNETERTELWDPVWVGEFCQEPRG